jgi:hypothetical protein
MVGQLNSSLAPEMKKRLWTIRMHVSIDPGEKNAHDVALFQKIGDAAGLGLPAMAGFLPKRYCNRGQPLLRQFLTSFGLPPMQYRQYFRISLTLSNKRKGC